jgi:hypothetical protein
MASSWLPFVGRPQVIAASRDKGESQATDLPQKLQELGLPILKGVPQHLYGIATDLRWLAVHHLLIDVGKPAK